MNVKAEALDQHKVQLTIDVPAEVVVKGFKPVSYTHLTLPTIA